MQNPNIKEKLLANWVAIVLATISIIQGLAFNFLVINLPNIIDHTYNTKNYLLLTHFLLSFALLLRVFQTYITAALDYDDWKVGLFDILTIFIVGTLEYYLFSTLLTNTFDIKAYHLRLSLISLSALLGYINAFFSIQPNTYVVFHDYARERKLQLVNILGISLVQINSLIILIANNITYYQVLSIVSFSALAIFFNIYYSVKITFLPRARRLEETNDKTVIKNRLENYPQIKIFKCTEKHLDDLLNLFFNNFSYVYIPIFDTSPRLTKKILRRIFKIRDGKHILGYSSFFIASDPEMKNLYGLMYLNKKEQNNLYSLIIVFILASVKVLFTLGLIGLFRVIFNSRMITNEIWKCSPNEMQITYIAIQKDIQSKGIGSALINNAKEIATKNNKKILSLEVRESNIIARKFFIQHGFKEIAIMNNEFDELLNLGPRIIMHMNL